MPEQEPQKEKQELKTLFVWKAPLRAFTRRSKKYFTNLSLIVLAISLILIFLKEFFLVGVILALLFVAYVYSTVEPEIFENKITTQGVYLGNHTYLWNELTEFWFLKRGDQHLLNIDTGLRFPSRLYVVVEDADVPKVKELLSSHLSFREEPKLTVVDRLFDFFATKLALS
jgi:hypothetical protein